PGRNPEVELAVEADAASVGPLHRAPNALELGRIPVSPAEADPVVGVVELIVLRPAHDAVPQLDLPERDLAPVRSAFEAHAADRLGELGVTLEVAQHLVGLGRRQPEGPRTG